MVTTRLPARYIIHKELKALLRRKFGGNYKVIVDTDEHPSEKGAN